MKPNVEFLGQRLKWSQEGKVLELCLLRDPLNEIDELFLDEMEILLDVLHEESNAIGCLIMYSSRTKGFSAGADLKALHAGLISNELTQCEKAKRVSSFINRIHNIFDQLDNLPITVISAVHGFCFGGGFELALTSDIIVADSSTRFAFPEMRLGIIPCFGGIPRLKKLTGCSFINDILLTGKSVSSKKAFELGIIAYCVPEGRSLEISRKLAKHASTHEVASIKALKSLLKKADPSDLVLEKKLFLEMVFSQTVVDRLDKFVKNETERPYI
ncbi:MAG: enoyl-CoA hydratase/isomerase family protein [Pseudobacteriovorax sp.]|nr:enoyl-CoA hydratase/isomerase family protein [Pseudobacteriovorax sp.]